MRTTLTLDDDVAAKLKRLTRQRGKPFRQVVNDVLREGLTAASPVPSTPFKMQARSLGRVRPGLNFDCVWQLLEEIEGPMYR